MTDNPEQSPAEPVRPEDLTYPQAGSAEEIPEIEDSSAPDAAHTPIEENLAEDDPNLLDPATRTVEGADDAQDGTPPDTQVASAAALGDDSSDTDAIADEGEPAGDTKDRLADSSTERKAHRIAVELKHVESEVRRLLENRDTRRKRRLGGTRRWLELEEDIISWRSTGRFEEDTLDQLGALIAKRHYYFDQLQFLSTVRPGWRAQPA